MLLTYLDSDEQIINATGIPFLTVQSLTSSVNKKADLKTVRPSSTSTFLMLFTVL